MSDKNWQNELTAYVDGELNEHDRREVEAALQRDPKLKALEAKLRQTVALMKTLPAPAPSASMKASVLGLLEEAPPKTSWFTMPKLVPMMALAAAAVIAVVLRGRAVEVPPAFVEEDQVLLAQNMELVEDLDLVGLTSPEDLEVIEQLKELEANP
jgi:anti-sigma factor RsiW